MTFSPSDLDLPIVILPIAETGLTVPDVRQWQIEEFLRQTGKAAQTQRCYRGQLHRFAVWVDKAWVEVTPSDLGKYRRDLKRKGLKPASINHAFNTLRSFYRWLRRSQGYPGDQPLPTEAIDLERQPEPLPSHLTPAELQQLWQVLSLEAPTRIRDRAIVSVLSHGLRASEVSGLNVGDWNGRILTVYRSKGQTMSEVPLHRQAREFLETYLDWRRQQEGLFAPEPDRPMFLCQDPRRVGQRLGYQGLHRMVKQLGQLAGVEGLTPHRFRHTFGTEVMRLGVDPLFGKELMGIKSDQVFQRYTQGVFKQAAAEAYLRAIGEVPQSET